MKGVGAYKVIYALSCKFSRVIVIAAYIGRLVQVKSMGSAAQAEEGPIPSSKGACALSLSSQKNCKYLA
jgi:hypothetical protein